MTRHVSLVWFRQDFRLADNPALRASLAHGAVVPVFIWSPDEEKPWTPGGASRWWLHQSLKSLDHSLRALGSRLIIRQGGSLETLQALAKETGAKAIYWNRRYEPAVVARDTGIKESLRAQGLTVESFNGALLHEPWTIKNKSGLPFQVFTPFWKHCLTLPDPAPPLPVPTNIPAPAHWPPSLTLEELALEPTIPWAEGMKACWRPGETGAAAALAVFLKDAFSGYSEMRNRPDLRGTSRLSPFLHFGEIGPRQIWQGLRDHASSQGLPESAWRTSQFLSEVGWREFAHQLLHHFPHTTDQPLRKEFARFPWSEDAEFLKAWQKGRTGYPIVDAGMRELWTTGWMHNRVRMIVASFLVKDLFIPWQTGARWFWDTLVDADLAQNTLGWQWTSGCGADAAPYFRIFNPVSQGEKFDPLGDYVRKWVPEIASLPDEWLHKPWEASASVLSRAKVELGVTYPQPIIVHKIARDRALEAFKRLNE